MSLETSNSCKLCDARIIGNSDGRWQQLSSDVDGSMHEIIDNLPLDLVMCVSLCISSLHTWHMGLVQYGCN